MVETAQKLIPHTTTYSVDGLTGSMTDIAMHLDTNKLTIGPTSFIDKIAIRDQNYEISLSPNVEAKLFQKFLDKMNEVSFTPTIEHKCHNCGGALEIKITEHIFRCPFCNSVYAIATQMKNDGR